MPSTSNNIYYFAHKAEIHVAKRPPVILIHGAGGFHLSWPPQIRRLAGQYVYAIDLPGHGKSEGVGRQSVDEYVEDVHGFINSLKIRTVVLMGISMGSAISLALAVKYPKKVCGLALFGSGLKLRVAPSLLESLDNPRSYESAVGTFNKNCFGPNASSRLIELSKQAMMEMRPSVLMGDFLACDQFDITGHIDGLNIPALIICGREDKMTPLKYSESLRDSIAGSQLHVMDGAGHMAMAEYPDLVAELLVKFVNAIPSHTRS
jgi:pimeloyl-ACP methyl ester carboxylesterase